MGKYLDATGLSHFISKIKTTFQEKLVSGTNIKTINNTSLLGSGNITISTDSTSTDISLDTTPMSEEAASYFEDWEGGGEEGADNVSFALNALYDGISSLSGGPIVTVTQSLSSGTQVGSISVDGNATALYAPTPPTASTTTPSGNGTAAVGTSTNYARADHVHPHDGSKMDKNPGGFSLAHGAAIDNMTDGELWLSPDTDGDVSLLISSDGTFLWSDADGNEVNVSLEGHTHSDLQPKLVSGTNIKTINNESLLGSGNITVSGSSSGGTTYSTVAVSIPTSAWSGTTATVNASSVTSSNDVIVAPAPASTTAWASAGIYCSAQGAGTLTFMCSTAPSEAVTANVMVFVGGAASASGVSF